MSLGARASRVVLDSNRQKRPKRWEKPPLEPQRLEARRIVFVALVTASVVIGVAARFISPAGLWLDEALSVNIARLPLPDLAGALRRDGSPPLYYVLLHGWTRLFGTGDPAVRALSGLIGVATLPLSYLAGRRLGGRQGAVSALLLVASSPFAIRYASETRMYALVMLLTLTGWLALERALERPSLPRLAALSLVTGLLLLTHYWALYLVAVVAVGLAISSRRGPDRRSARRALCSLAAGSLALAPWLPVLLFQLRHTGAPWGPPASWRDVLESVGEFAGGRSASASLLAPLLHGLTALALFGRALDGRRVELDLATRPPGRHLATVTFLTLAVGVAGGLVSGNAFAPRYASIVLMPYLLLATVGTLVLVSTRVRGAVLGTAVVLGLAGGFAMGTAPRTQAGEVARVVWAGARPADVVAYCPDQLGPSVSRLLPGGIEHLTYPGGTAPELVDWVDYGGRNRRASPEAFAQILLDRAAPDASIWLVWSPGYRSFEGRCARLADELRRSRPLGAVLLEPSHRYLERAGVTRFIAP